MSNRNSAIPPSRYLEMALGVLISGASPTGLAQDSAVLETIVVTATRSNRVLQDVPASIAVRDFDELRRDGFTYGTDEYRGVTGVFFRRGEGDGDEFPFVSFRGSTGTEGSLSLVDGIPVIGLYEETQLNEIPYQAIETIEIVKGPVSALYGRGALYGATNYRTRTPVDDSGSISLVTSSLDYNRVDAGLTRITTAGHSFLLNASYEDFAGWRANGGRQLLNLFTKGTLQVSPERELALYANFNDRSSELPNGIPLDVDGNVLPVAGGREGFLGYGKPGNESMNRMLAARLTQALGTSTTAQLTAAYRDIDRNVFLNFFDPFGTDHSRKVIGFNGFRGTTSQEVAFAEGTIRFGKGAHSLMAGISGEQSRIAENIRWSGQNGFTFECGFTFYLAEVDYNTGTVLNTDHPCFVLDNPQTRDNFDNDYWGVFVQDEITLAPRWYATLGARYDDFSRDARYFPIPGVSDGGTLDGQADAFSPKASLSFRPDWGQLYVAYGRGFNSNFGATFEWDPVQYARPQSKPTTIDSLEVGAKGSMLGGLVHFEAAVYVSEQKNRRQVINNPDAETDFTQPGSLIAFGDLYRGQGAELSVYLKPSELTDLTVSYSRIDPEWKDYVLQTFAGPVNLSGNSPTGVPRNTWFLQAAYRPASWADFRVTYEVYDDYYLTLDNSFSNGGYELLGLSARLVPASWSGLSLDLAVTNALDQEYYFYFGGRNAPTYATPGMPREIRLSLRAAF